MEKMKFSIHDIQSFFPDNFYVERERGWKGEKVTTPNLPWLSSLLYDNAKGLLFFKLLFQNAETNAKIHIYSFTYFGVT